MSVGWSDSFEVVVEVLVRLLNWLLLEVIVVVVVEVMEVLVVVMI